MSTTHALQAPDQGPLELASIVGVLSTRFSVATGVQQRVRRMRLDTFDRRLRVAGLTLEHQIVASQERLVFGRRDGSSTLAVRVRRESTRRRGR